MADLQSSGKSSSVSQPVRPGLNWDEVSAELVEFFASIKLAMSLFIVLAITATIGTVIQQDQRPEVYIQEYGEVIYRWFARFGFTDVYHTLPQAVSGHLALDAARQGQCQLTVYQKPEAHC